MSLVKSNWYIFVNSVTDVSQHELLECDRFKLYFLFNFLSRALQTEFLWTAVVEEI